MARGKIHNLKKIIGIILMTGIFVFGSGIIPNNSQHNAVSAYTVHPCLNYVNIPMNELSWLYIPEFEYELNTQEDYFYLAGQLISNKIVDASACPLGGLTQNGYANGCGMATARPAVIEIQNMLNGPILEAWKEVGVPPVLLKQLIRQESQFWPGFHTYGENNTVYEYGFGHITLMGLQTALQWNHDLYNKVCATSGSDNCAYDYAAVNQALLSLVATCNTCKNGINSEMVNRSVDILAETVMGYCYQTSQLIYNATDWYPSLVVDYPTLWKLTLMNYTSGPNCVLNAVSSTFEMTDGPMDWYDISANVTTKYCQYGKEYANRITAKYFDFPPNK